MACNAHPLVWAHMFSTHHPMCSLINIAHLVLMMCCSKQGERQGLAFHSLPFQSFHESLWSTTLGPQCHQSAVLQAKLDPSLCLGCSNEGIRFIFLVELLLLWGPCFCEVHSSSASGRPNREVGEAADQWMVCHNCLHRQDGNALWGSVSVIHNITQVANLPDEF